MGKDTFWILMVFVCVFNSIALLMCDFITLTIISTLIFGYCVCKVLKQFDE